MNDPETGVKAVSADVLIARATEMQEAKAKANGANGTTNGANGHGGMPDDEYFETASSFHSYVDHRTEAEIQEDKVLQAKLPPHNDKAEAYVLVAEIYNPACIPEVRQIVSRHDFYSESNALIHEACLWLHDEGKDVHEASVLDRLVDAGSTRTVSKRYWDWLLTSVPVQIRVASHAEIIAKTAQLRRIANACEIANFSITSGVVDISSVVETLRSQVESFRPTQPFQTPNDVITQWGEDGSLIHEPTGIPPLDNATGGGPVYGTRWIVNGAPDAGKTALLVQIGHTYALRGIAVGFLAADEESSDLQTRLAQREQFSRMDCEVRRPETLERMKGSFGDLPVRFYRTDMTIESAADSLATWAQSRGSRAVLIIDSIQTVTSAKVVSASKDLSTRELVTENVRALKNVAMRHKLIALATSEMNRSAYRNGKGSGEDQNDMASGAESRAIEYLARVLLTLRSVKGDGDLVEVALPKNKHGRSGESFFLRIDRRRMMLFESEGPSAPPDSSPEDERAEKERASATRLAAQEALVSAAKQETYRREEAILVAVVAEQPGIGTHELRAAMAAKMGGCGRTRVDDTIARLGKRLRIDPGSRGARLHYLNEQEVDS
jgi:replicative DNA helicase